VALPAQQPAALGERPGPLARRCRHRRRRCASRRRPSLERPERAPAGFAGPTDPRHLGRLEGQPAHCCPVAPGVATTGHSPTAENPLRHWDLQSAPDRIRTSDLRFRLGALHDRAARAGSVCRRRGRGRSSAARPLRRCAARWRQAARTAVATCRAPRRAAARARPA
jgi:hypothetical protein